MHCLNCATELAERSIEGRIRAVCPSCGWVDYRHLKVSAGVLLEHEGKLLLARRAEGSKAFAGAWNLPAGYCEPDEPPASAAEREALEEVGLSMQVGRLFDAYFFDDDSRGNGILLVYEASMPETGRPPGLVLSEEVEAAGFFGPGDLPEPLCGAGHDRAVFAWRERALDRWVPGGAPRFCPHCARRLQQREAFGRERPVCASCGFVHFRELKVGVSLVMERGQDVLLIRRAEEPGRGLWALPSGFVEWDERPEAAVCRECIEETGLVAGPPTLIGASYYSDDFRGPGINLSYSAQVIGGRLRAGDDASDVRFFAREDLPPPEQIAFRGHADLLEKLRGT